MGTANEANESPAPVDFEKAMYFTRRQIAAAQLAFCHVAAPIGVVPEDAIFGAGRHGKQWQWVVYTKDRPRLRGTPHDDVLPFAAGLANTQEAAVAAALSVAPDARRTLLNHIAAATSGRLYERARLLHFAAKHQLDPAIGIHVAEHALHAAEGLACRGHDAVVAGLTTLTDAEFDRLWRMVNDAESKRRKRSGRPARPTLAEIDATLERARLREPIEPATPSNVIVFTDWCAKHTQEIQ